MCEKTPDSVEDPLDVECSSGISARTLLGPTMERVREQLKKQGSLILREQDGGIDRISLDGDCATSRTGLPKMPFRSDKVGERNSL